MAMNFGLAGTAATLCADKNQYGSFGNRVVRTKDHVVNNLKTSAKVAATGVLAASIALNKKHHGAGIKRVIIKMGNSIQDFVKTVKKEIGMPKTKIGKGVYDIAKNIGKGLNKIGEKMVKDPKTFAIGASALLIGTLTANIIGKHFYNAGKIDQKYEDKARTQDILTKMDA